MATFLDRIEAGDRLAALVATKEWDHPFVLALPRGGVPVAARVAALLQAPLEVLVSRKLGVPSRPELGFGAISEGGAIWIDPSTTRLLGLPPEVIEEVAEREAREVERRIAIYRRGAPLPPLAGKTAVLVDDGVATGCTMRAAILSARHFGAARVVAAVPVAAAETAQELRPLCDEWVCVEEPEILWAIGLWYRSFPQLDDSEVLSWLGRSAPPQSPEGPST